MRGLRVVSCEAFTLLRRDKIFLPAIGVALTVCLVANAMSNWSIEEFAKVLYDVGLFGLQLTGGLVAIFWGVKSVADAKQDGALESQLAWPVRRATWIVGKYLGLALALALFGLVAIALWQALMLVNQFGVMRRAELLAFAGLLTGWLVLGALAVMLATMARQALATFLAVVLWIAGLSTALIANSLPPGSSALSLRMAKAVARAWDLTQFVLVDQAVTGAYNSSELAWRGAYGGLLILAMITVGCMVFTRRDGAP